MLILGQVRFSKGCLCPTGLGKGPAEARKRKKHHLQIIINNPRSSIKPESAPGPIFFNEHVNLILFISDLYCIMTRLGSVRLLKAHAYKPSGGLNG